MVDELKFYGQYNQRSKKEYLNQQQHEMNLETTDKA